MKATLLAPFATLALVAAPALAAAPAATTTTATKSTADKPAAKHHVKHGKMKKAAAMKTKAD
jgi:hypothetical protein